MLTGFKEVYNSNYILLISWLQVSINGTTQTQVKSGGF